MANIKLMCDDDPNFYYEVNKVIPPQEPENPKPPEIVIPPTLEVTPTTPFFTAEPTSPPIGENPRFSLVDAPWEFESVRCKAPFEPIFMDDDSFNELDQFLRSKKVSPYMITVNNCK